MRPERTSDNCATLVVANVKVRTEAQQFIPPLSLHGLLRETSHLYATTGRKPVTIGQDMAVLNLSENKEQRQDKTILPTNALFY